MWIARASLVVLSVVAPFACGEGAPAVPSGADGAGESPTLGGERAAGEAGVYGIAPPATGGFPSVVLLEPVERTAAGPGDAPARSPFLDQIGSAFYPPAVVTRVGEDVEFLNSEGVMHNVHVSAATGETVLNLATPPGFDSYRHAFAAPGVYRVTCDIHPNMTAFIVAAESPYAAVAQADGRFEISGVPPGSYRASVWNLDESRRLTRVVEITGERVELDLDGGAD